MSKIDETLQPYIDSGEMPGLVAAAATSDGIFYEEAFGKRGLLDDRPMTTDSIFRIFSMTKAIGTAAAVLLIERGEIELDQPVEDILPEFNKIQVLDGFDGDQPRLRAPKSKATVRHLATHTSGLVYEFWNTDIPQYMEATGHPTIISGLNQSLYYPMVHDPGTKWDYGISIDWLGRIVEEVSGKRIDQFCQEELFDPLGMKDTTFEVEGEKADRLVGVHIRGEDGKLGPFELAPPSKPEVYGMGHALYSTARDYLQFLMMLLKGGEHNGNRIFQPETVELMKQNHIGELMVEMLKTSAPPITADAEFFPGVPKKHTLGFVTNLEDIPGMRAAGSQTWAGVLNTHYWWDPKNDVAGVILMQFLPFADPKAIEIYNNFERAVYASR